MPWIDITDLKVHLNKTTTGDDAELEGFVNAACAVIEDLKGHVDPVEVTEVVSARWIPQAGVGHPYYVGPPYGGYSVYPGRRYLIDLRQPPVASITSVGRYDGGTPTVIDPENLTTGALGWLLRDNVLYVPTGGEYTVTYSAGRNPVPDNYVLAAVELAAHLWRASQLNQNSGRPPVGGDQMMVLPHMASALPYRVRELLGIYGDVVNEHVVIA